VLGGRAYRASASVGIAIYPDDGTTQTGLQAVADERMYARKDDRQAGAAKAQFRFGQQMGDASRA
jgi:GGDEF domain-containing protein